MNKRYELFVNVCQTVQFISKNALFGFWFFYAIEKIKIKKFSKLPGQKVLIFQVTG